MAVCSSSTVEHRLDSIRVSTYCLLSYWAPGVCWLTLYRHYTAQNLMLEESIVSNHWEVKKFLFQIVSWVDILASEVPAYETSLCSQIYPKEVIANTRDLPVEGLQMPSLSSHSYRHWQRKPGRANLARGRKAPRRWSKSNCTFRHYKRKW